MTMKCLRSLVLLLCLAPFWLAAGPAHASQTSVSAKPVQAKEKTAVSAKPPRKQASTPRKASTKAASKRKAASKAVAKPLPQPRLDLSLPADLVEKLEPGVDKAPLARKPVLPAMFDEKPSTDTSFQLNGRLISNEMDLQLRNDSRRDVEGAAIDFQFKQ